jgi:hypothetical protein
MPSGETVHAGYSCRECGLWRTVIPFLIFLPASGPVFQVPRSRRSGPGVLRGGSSGHSTGTGRSYKQLPELEPAEKAGT